MKYVKFVVKTMKIIVPLQTRIWLLVIICKVLKVGPLSFVRMEAAFFSVRTLLTLNVLIFLYGVEAGAALLPF